MLERYIQQILTMKLFADTVTIIDDQGIVRYFKAFREEHVPIHFADIIGKNFMDVFTDVDPENSTFLKALQGDPTYYNRIVTDVTTGHSNEVIESVYPLELNEKIIGAVCVTRGIGSAYEPLRKITLQPIEDTAGSEDSLSALAGDSMQMHTLKSQIQQIAATDANVLICGETGTGKELVAKALHNCSHRRKKPFFPQNCAAIPPNLAESILFGSEKGIYTGSVSRAGILEMAAGGTVFLDEVNSLELSVQAKLLKSLEEKQVRRLGASASLDVDFRVIAATNEDPFDCVKLGKIRRDLFYRLSTVIIEVPPLRNRDKDVLTLADHFIRLHNQKTDLEILGLSKSAENIFMAYSWPGNVRELKNAIEYALLFTHSTIIEEDSIPRYIRDAVAGKNAAEEGDPAQAFSGLPAPAQTAADSLLKSAETASEPAARANLPAVLPLPERPLPENATLKDAVEAFEKAFLAEKLRQNSNHSLLASQLDVTRQTLLNKIRKYQL